MNIERIHDYNIDLENNEIYLFYYKEIDRRISNQFLKNIVICGKSNPEKELIVHMDIEGGAWEPGMAIYDSIKTYPYETTIICYSSAESMSSIILQAANKRLLMPNGVFLLHPGFASINGTLKQTKSATDYYTGTYEVMIDIYSNRIKQSNGKLKNKSLSYIKKWLRELMDKKEDVYFSAKEAVQYGLADNIIEL